MEPIWVAGLMSGTSLDGTIDVALIKTDGNIVEKFSSASSFSYDQKTVKKIRECIITAREWDFKGVEPEIFKTTEEVITIAQAEAMQSFIKLADLDGSLDLIGFHGQTILHKPPLDLKSGSTRQLGNGPLMAEILKVPVVYDFRTADMKVGGQGAPLCPPYHRALLKRLKNPTEVAVLNLGGIGNITWADNDDLIAFDTGPANAPINDYVHSLNLGNMDKDGLLASRGVTDETVLANIMSDPYFSKTYPKSLDRHDFLINIVAELSVEDAIATLTSLCGATVSKALDLLPRRPKEIIVCGGGRHNPMIIKEIRERAQIKVYLAEDFGWRGDSIEAECFGFLAVRSFGGLPISFPKTTGVPVEMCGGTLCYP
ncbi:MAG: anhydro-N-acetylmuramic acid kinase [Rhodobacteraceae bacterium]|nr:anhydro-N-acetylmuramic acid kinase [Paracoccaceae bacterium]